MKLFTTVATALALVAAGPAVAAAKAAPVPASETNVQAEGAMFEELGAAAYIAGAVLLGLFIWGLIELTDDDDGVSP